jgi:hypothetical protein
LTGCNGSGALIGCSCAAPNGIAQKAAANHRTAHKPIFAPNFRFAIISYFRRWSRLWTGLRRKSNYFLAFSS